MVTALLVATALLFAAQTEAQKGGPVGPPGARPNRECYCWTNWLDRDNPSKKGDYERVEDFRRQSRPPVCAKPVHVYCRIKNTGAYYPYGSGETIVSILIVILLLILDPPLMLFHIQVKNLSHIFYSLQVHL